MDDTSSAELLPPEPVERCTLNSRRGRNPEAPKRQLLTGYIIYASEIRKQIIDKNPNQNFGDISRIVGNEWKALPHDIRSKYDQRALMHNKRVRERAQNAGNQSHLLNGSSTPKMTKRKLAKIAKEEMRQHHLSIPYKSLHNQSHNEPQTPTQQTPTQVQVSSTNNKTATTMEKSTQASEFRFVEPPAKKKLIYSETFKKYIQGLEVSNNNSSGSGTSNSNNSDSLQHHHYNHHHNHNTNNNNNNNNNIGKSNGIDRNSNTEKMPDTSTWLGKGIGRHESVEAALWALRDFMLQDIVKMRTSVIPYL